MAGLVGEVAYWARLFFFFSKIGPSGFVRRGEKSRTLHFNPSRLEKYRNLVNNLCHSCHMYVTY